MNFLLDWIDHRTGFRHLMSEALDENVPSGARFRYITGSMLVFAFVTQAITGVFLWMAYSPSSQTAYESVWWIQHQMIGGWLVRGIHHFVAQAMVVVMGLHLLQIVWDGAYRKPREINHWLGLVLMQLVMGLGLTGYLLPWDQKGYWATSVATNLATLSPVAGKETQLLAVGGSEYGHHTLIRFFALHAGVLPILLILFLAMHIAAFRKHGITAHITPSRPDDAFWPKQVLYDAIGCCVLLGGVLFAIWFYNGAELGAPADPSKQYSAARPEWYFLFLFQLLKYFPGSSEVIGAIVIPGLAMGVLFLMPFIGRSEFGHRVNRVIICSLLLAAGVLTMLALREDYFALLAERFGYDQKKYSLDISKSRDFLHARESAEHESHRMNELINRRLVKADGQLSEPLFLQKQGAVYLLRNDPLTQGPELFAAKCASCHANHDPAEKPELNSIRDFVAPNLQSFASRKWIAGLLDPAKIATPHYFGNTAHKNGRMVQWVAKHGAKLKEEDRAAIVAALSAQAQLRTQAKQDRADADLIAKGIPLIQQNCANGCHKFGDVGQLGLAPDLTGYGSYEWMLGFLSNPEHERFYRQENDAMPAFAENLADPATHKVSVRELSLIVDWLRGEYYQADDERPVLPHDEETARRTVAEARATTTPERPLVGAAQSTAKVSATERAETLFAANCLACHSHANEHGQGLLAIRPSAPNLFGFASAAWMEGLLDPTKIASHQYFGGTAHAKGDMVGFVKDNFGESDLDDEKKEHRAALAAAFAVEAKLPGAKAMDDKALQKGRDAFTSIFACGDCHRWGDAGEGEDAPNLTGWGSREWLVKMISNPAHEGYYPGSNDRMPAFAEHHGAKRALLITEEIEILARWIRGEKLD